MRRVIVLLTLNGPRITYSVDNQGQIRSRVLGGDNGLTRVQFSAPLKHPQNFLRLFSSAAASDSLAQRVRRRGFPPSSDLRPSEVPSSCFSSPAGNFPRSDLRGNRAPSRRGREGRLGERGCGCVCREQSADRPGGTRKAKPAYFVSCS